MCPWVKGLFQMFGLWSVVLPPTVGALCHCFSLFLGQTMLKKKGKIYLEHAGEGEAQGGKL